MRAMPRSQKQKLGLSGLENINISIPPPCHFVTCQKFQRVVADKYLTESSEVRYNGGSVEKNGQEKLVGMVGG